MEKIFYKIDNILVEHSSFKLWILAFISILAVVSGSLLLYFNNGDISSSLWNSWTYLVDPGTHVELDNGYNRFIAVFITIIGMLIFALLIGLISESLNEKFNNLKNGTTHVYEDNHILILGYSDKIFSLISQIDFSEKKTSSNIVLLSDNEKNQVENDLSANIKNINTKIICRSGNIDRTSDLKKVNIHKAKYILLLSNSKSYFSDEFNLKVILTLVKELKIDNIPITVEIQSDKYKFIFENLEAEYKNLNIIYTKDSMARLLAQSSIFKGITKVYDKLFDFNGDNFSLIENNSLYNQSLFSISKQISNATFCGIYSFNLQELILDNNYIYTHKDKLLILSNGSPLLYSNRNDFTQKHIDLKIVHKISTLLIIGYNEVTNTILSELNDSVKLNVLIASKNEIDISNNYLNLNLNFIQYNHLEELELSTVDKILITSDLNNINIIEKDSQVLAILMYLRIKDKNKEIVSEIFDTNTMNLVNKDTNNDYIVSDDLISKFLSTVANSNEISIIVNDLLKSGGNLIRIIENPASTYNYIDLYYSLIKNNIILIGYIKNNIIEINPDEKNTYIDFDKVIVIDNSSSIQREKIKL